MKRFSVRMSSVSMVMTDTDLKRVFQESVRQSANKSATSGAIYARSSVIFPHCMAFVGGG